MLHCGVAFLVIDITVATARPFLLFLVNVIFIKLPGVGTFLIQSTTPRSWWEADRARRSSKKALFAWSAILAVLSIMLYLWETNH
jgi:hypothetical protein